MNYSCCLSNYKVISVVYYCLLSFNTSILSDIELYIYDPSRPKYGNVTSQQVAKFSIREKSDLIFLFPILKIVCIQIFVFLPYIFCQI